MREIKFRAWDKEKNKFVQDVDGVSLDGQILDLWMSEHGIGNRDRDVVLMQYTGLKDKNGKEVYEGDVLSTNLTSPDAIKFVYVKCFSGGEYVFKATTENYSTSWRELCNLDVEVIGNIYSNPELLK